MSNPSRISPPFGGYQPSFLTRSRPQALALAGLLALCTPLAQALTFTEALALAEQHSPALQAQSAVVAGSQAALPAASTLPDPRLTLGVENLPISGADRYSLTRDFMTMQRIGLMQEVPNSAKREARTLAAEARTRREQTALAGARLQLRQSLTRAWWATRSVGQRMAVLDEMVTENQRLQDTLLARVSAGSAQASDLLMARQEALALADRRDDLQRDEAKARAALQALVGARAAEALADDAPLATPDAHTLHEQMPRHADLAVFAAMRDMAQAELREAQAESRGDWAWEVAYSKRGSQWGDMVSFQLSMDLPWQKKRRQEPMVDVKLRELDRIEAERLATHRKHAQELDEQLAELQALERQHERVSGAGLALARERAQLALSSYQSGRADLGMVLAARRDLLELRLRAIDLQAQRVDLRARLDNLSLDTAP